MKKIAKVCVAILALSALTDVAFAANPGAYAGLGLGVSRQETPNQFLIQGKARPLFNQSREIGGLGGRVFGGYNFNNYFGVEAGLAGFAQSKYNSELKLRNMSIANIDAKYNTMTTFDVVGKGYLPIADSGVNVYGLGGLALVHSKVDASVSSSVPALKALNISKSKTNNSIRPVAGAGISYDIPQTQLTTNVEYSHVFGRGDVKKSISAIPSSNMLTLGLAYNFG